MAKYEKVNIAGHELAVKFGFSALALFEKESGESINNIAKYGEAIPINLAICLVYAGLKDGARVSKNKFNLSLEDVADLLDEDVNALSKILQVFGDMMGGKKKQKIKKVTSH